MFDITANTASCTQWQGIFLSHTPRKGNKKITQTSHVLGEPGFFPQQMNCSIWTAALAPLGKEHPRSLELKKQVQKQQSGILSENLALALLAVQSKILPRHPEFWKRYALRNKKWKLKSGKHIKFHHEIPRTSCFVIWLTGFF